MPSARVVFLGDYVDTGRAGTLEGGRVDEWRNGGVVVDCDALILLKWLPTHAALGRPPESAPDEDENRTNGLLFFALDPERNFLYVVEQSNNRVRCVSLNGPHVLTSTTAA